MNCIECKHDVSELITFDREDTQVIECPNCHEKMTVEWFEETKDSGYWWLDKYYTD